MKLMTFEIKHMRTQLNIYDGAVLFTKIVNGSVRNYKYIEYIYLNFSEAIFVATLSFVNAKLVNNGNCSFSSSERKSTLPVLL